MLAYILLQRIAGLLLATGRRLLLLFPSVTRVPTEVRESGFILLPPELLCHIFEYLEPERTQINGSRGPALALSQ